MHRRLDHAVWAALVCGCLWVGCGHSTLRPRPYPQPAAAALVAALEQRSRAVSSLRAESIMDYWIGDERVRGSVLIMGRVGESDIALRVVALSPAGDTVAADLACRNAAYKFVDYQNDCQRRGPCSKETIARFLRVLLEPRDFLLIASGSIPLIAHASAALAWDGDQEVLTLVGRDRDKIQTVALVRNGTAWNVVASTVKDRAGRIEWRLQNKAFTRVRGEDGCSVNVPEKSRLERPQEKTDLLVSWKRRTFNLPLADEKFDFEIPAGLPLCH